MQDYYLNKKVTVSYCFGFLSAVKENAVSCIHENTILGFFKCITAKKITFNY